LKRPHRHGPGNSAPPDVLAARGAEALLRERFKEAIELFKLAIRQEPRPAWKEALADAWRGRARDLAAKSMFKEAAMVLENTIASGGPVRDPKLYVTCLIRDGQQQKAAVYLLSHPAPSGGGAEDLEALAAAFLVAIPRLPDPAPMATPDQVRWRELAVASRAALAAWSAGAPAEEIDRLLNAISLRSAFRPVRLLLKRLIAAPADADRARHLLETISPGSPFHPLRQAVTTVVCRDTELDADTWNRLTTGQQAFVAETSGLAAPAAQFLARLAGAERGGPGVLFNLLVNQTDLPQADLRSACLNLLPQIPDRVSQFEKTFGALSAMERHRVQALTAESRGNWEAAGRHWQSMVAAIGDGDEPSGKARLSQGVILRHLAGLAAKHEEIEAGEFFEDPVIHYLERARAVDPDHLPSHLELIGHHRKAATSGGSSAPGNSSSKDWHQLMDETVRRFPDDASVLQQALDSALARKAYKQAEGFARRLLKINSINPGVRRQMIELQISYARKQVRAKRTDLALKAVTEALSWERADVPSAPLRIIRGLVERRIGTEGHAVTPEGGPEAPGDATLREGVALAGGGVAGWFRARLEAELMKDGDTSWLHRELIRARETPPTADAVMAIVSAVSQPEVVENEKAVAALLLGMRSWLRQAAAIDWKPAEFEAVADMFTRFGSYDLLRDYAEAARQRDPTNPTWRFHAIVARNQGDPYRLTEGDEDELDGLAKAAVEREDFHMLSRIDRFTDGDANLDGGTRRGGHRVPADEPEDLDEIMALFSAALMDMPRSAAVNLRKRVNEFGREQALTELVGQMKSSPMGPGLPEPLLREICAAMVAQAMRDGMPKSGGGRRRSFF
jgi:cellulose synthase operon protein C